MFFAKNVFRQKIKNAQFVINKASPRCSAIMDQLLTYGN